MSKRHPTLKDLEIKRAHIKAEAAVKSKAHPEGRDVMPFDLILKCRKIRHDFNPCARENCALRNANVDDLITQLALADAPPPAPQEVTTQ
jgi:hypothetical protein